MDRVRSSASEEEPFLDYHISKTHCYQRWNLKRLVILCLTAHFILLASFATIMIYIIGHKTIRSSFSFDNTASPKGQITFGGLPVQHDDPIGPYVVCPSAGGPSAALEAGCSFDILGNGWMPSPCFDAEMHAFFAENADYHFWSDKEKHHRVQQAEILEGTMAYPVVFASFEHHHEHCRYLLNGTLRYARDSTVGVMELHKDPEHMEHCIDFLGESPDPLTQDVVVKAYFEYRRCYLPQSNSELTLSVAAQ